MSAVVMALVLALAGPMQAGATDQAPAQAIVIPPDGALQELLLIDGTRAIGRVEEVDEDAFTFRTTAGVLMRVERSQMRALAPAIGRVVNGDYWPPDSNPTRLFFAPTGRSLKRGEAYLGVYEVLLPFVQYGVTDTISIGAGTPLVFGGGEVPFWITPKVQVLKRRSTEASLGVLHFFNVDDVNLGIAYGVVTQGNSDSAFTLGGGYAYAWDEGDDGGGPVLMVGGEHRLSRRLKLVTENYAFAGGGLVSGGLRFLGERLSVDLGLVSPLGEEDFVAFPVVNFVWKF